MNKESSHYKRNKLQCVTYQKTQEKHWKGKNKNVEREIKDESINDNNLFYS